MSDRLFKNAVNKIKREIKDEGDSDLVKFSNELLKIYNKFRNKRNDELINYIKRIVKNPHYIKYVDITKKINSIMSSFTDNEMKRNIYIIQCAIQETLDNRHRVVIKSINF